MKIHELCNPCVAGRGGCKVNSLNIPSLHVVTWFQIDVYCSGSEKDRYQQIKIGNSFIPIFIVFKKHSCIQRNKISTFNYAENKTQKAHEMCRFVHLALGVFCFPSYLGWCQHPTWKPTMATSSNCSIRSRRARRSHHSCQKPSEEQETWELRGQREMLSNSPKTYKIKGQPLQQWATSLKLNILNIWSNRHSFPASIAVRNTKS